MNLAILSGALLSSFMHQQLNGFLGQAVVKLLRLRIEYMFNVHTFAIHVTHTHDIDTNTCPFSHVHSALISSSLTCVLVFFLNGYKIFVFSHRFVHSKSNQACIEERKNESILLKKSATIQSSF